MTATKVVKERKYCGAKKRQGTGNCTRPAGWGTDHVGQGCCKLHGGKTPMHGISAAREEARSIVGPLVDVEPAAGLLWLVQREATVVCFYERLLAQVKEADLIAPPVTTLVRESTDETFASERREHPAAPHVLVQMWNESKDRFARYCKLALDAGIDERRVRSAERMGDLVAALLETVFETLGVKPAERAKVLPIVQTRMLELETSKEDAA